MCLFINIDSNIDFTLATSIEQTSAIFLHIPGDGMKSNARETVYSDFNFL